MTVSRSIVALYQMLSRDTTKLAADVTPTVVPQDQAQSRVMSTYGPTTSGAPHSSQVPPLFERATLNPRTSSETNVNKRVVKRDVIRGRDFADRIGAVFEPSPQMRSSFAWGMNQGPGRSVISRRQIGLPEYTSRAVAYHEGAHALDPEIYARHQNEVQALLAWGNNRQLSPRLSSPEYLKQQQAAKAIDSVPDIRYEPEIPAMVVENATAMRNGWSPQQPSWVYDHMKKHGPQFKNHLKTDVPEIRSFMNGIRGDTELGRRYRDYLKAQGVRQSVYAP